MMLVSRKCTAKECSRLHYARGWCKMHYNCLRRDGSLRVVQVQARKGMPWWFVREVVIPYEADDCLVWPYGKVQGGRSRIRHEGRNRSVSSVVCEIVHGLPPTPKHEVAHSCGKGHEGCVNPRHLRWATHTENMADAIRHGTTTRGERHSQVKLTEAQVHRIRALKGKRPPQEIAETFGVSKSTIRSIYACRTWSWLWQNRQRKYT